MKDYIAVDWGSTQLRGWLIRNGQCVETKQLPMGITRLNGRSPADVFAEHLAPWRGAQALPVLMAGMIGSDAGWQAVPYLDCPTAIDAPGRQLCAVAEGVWIIPGLKIEQDGDFNVMRGEETQLLGARTLSPSSVYVMPGTHCKWVQADAEQIHDFRTVMTGELHHLLLNHSLVGAGLPEQKSSPEAFAAGLARGIACPVVLPQLFEVRASHVLGDLPREQVSEFLSGLLIGAEVASMRDFIAHEQAITIVAGASLTSRYEQAFRAVGLTVSTVPGDTAFQAGIRSIAHAVAN